MNTLKSLPSIDPKTIAQIQIALSQWGTDAEFLAKFVESVMKVTRGSGFGKISVYIQEKKVSMIRSEETHAFSDIEEKKL